MSITNFKEYVKEAQAIENKKLISIREIKKELVEELCRIFNIKPMDVLCIRIDADYCNGELRTRKPVDLKKEAKSLGVFLVQEEKREVTYETEYTRIFYVYLFEIDYPE